MKQDTWEQITTARIIRLRTIRGLLASKTLSLAQAREALAGPLSPDDPSTQYDDSSLLDQPPTLAELFILGDTRDPDTQEGK